jgi:hypothetical protein
LTSNNANLELSSSLNRRTSILIGAVSLNNLATASNSAAVIRQLGCFACSSTFTALEFDTATLEPLYGATPSW